MENVNLFDSSQQFVMPPESDIAQLPPEAQERFKAVQAADEKLTAAIANKQSVQARIVANAEAARATDAELKSMGPAWTPIDEARAFIQAEQDQRARERGY